MSQGTSWSDPSTAEPLPALVDDFLRPKVAVRKLQRSFFCACRAPKQANFPAEGAGVVECLNLLFVSGQDAIERGENFHCKEGIIILPAGVPMRFLYVESGLEGPMLRYFGAVQMNKVQR